MYTKKDYLEMKIIDALPPAEDLHSLAVGDIYGDGRNIAITGGDGGLFWYIPEIPERGTIDTGYFHVGLSLEDIDGDGILEVVAAKQYPGEYEFQILWFKPGKSLIDVWTPHVLDPHCAGNPHDILFTDIDGDGEREMLAVAAYSETPGIFLYKHHGRTDTYWEKHAVMEGRLTEGLAVADLNADGRLEIVSGPDWYICPEGGPYSGRWKRGVYASGFRDMCRMVLIDIAGSGRMDIVAVESEYKEGHLSWFENRILEDPDNSWIEHPIEDGFIFAHSLQAWKDEESGRRHVFLAEMAQGGWQQPYNWDARLIEYTTCDSGLTWDSKNIYKGAGTHQALILDIDRDGDFEVVGKSWKHPIVQIWKRRKEPSSILDFKHRFIDRDKPLTGTDILAVDVNGDGLEDVVCSKWWYRNPGWERFEIPGIHQAVNFYDIDGDGRMELICIKEANSDSGDFYTGLSSDFCWLKPVDPEHGKWEEYMIGKGTGSWPHGTVAAPLLPGGKGALVASYHSAKEGHFPEIFEIPDDPKKPWTKRILAEIAHGEEMKAFDMNGNGRLDLVAGTFLLENKGDGNFVPRCIANGFDAARICAGDINGDGKPDIVAGEEILDFDKREAPFARLVWFENPGNQRDEPWKMHMIDTVRCPHSISLADIDGDGEAEILCGEHNPFEPYRSRSRLLVYKKADPRGLAWYRYLWDDRFEHRNGVKVIELRPGNFGIISHGWNDSRFVHLWEKKG